MTREQISQTVSTILIDEFEIEADAVVEEANLFQDLGLDSLDAVDLFVSLETAFGGRVPEEDAKKVRSVGDVTTLFQTALFGG